MSRTARHIAIVTPPTAGHINPLIALGTALTGLGHRVTLVNMADAAPLVATTAIDFAPLGHPDDVPGRLQTHFDMLAQPSGMIGLPRMIRSVAGMTGLLLDALPAALTRLGVDAVIADAAEPAGVLVARHLGLPVVTAVTGLPLLREPDVPPPFLGWRYRPDAIGRNRNAGGYAVSDLLMTPITRLIARHARRWRLDADPRHAWSDRLQIAQCPAGLDFPRAALPAAFHYSGPWRLPEAVDPLPEGDGRPLVFCSLGSLQGARKSLFAAMTRACAAVGARALVAHGGGLTAAEAAELPGDPIVRAFWNQTTLLSRCAAAILHGGFNTVLDALASGIPVLAVPLAFEQPATAARLTHVGAGRVVTPRAAEAGALEPALRAILTDPRYRRAAGSLAAEIATAGGVGQAAALVDTALARPSRIRLAAAASAPPPLPDRLSASGRR